MAGFVCGRGGSEGGGGSGGSVCGGGGSGGVDWGLVRGDFPVLDQLVHGCRLVYLDSAASSQRPRVVMEAVGRYYERDHANVHRGVHELSSRATAVYEGARERVARFFNAGSGREVVFTRGSTESLNLLASCLGGGLGVGDQVLLTEMEHHSALVPWQLLAERCGFELVFWPVRELGGGLDWDALDGLLTERVRVVGCVHVSNSLGVVNDVGAICRRAREVGAVSVVDGAQSAGHGLVDVRGMGCDFYVFSGHKMCGPMGIGGLYGRLELLEGLPPYQGGGEMIEEVRFDGVSFKGAPHRFEAGTPNVGGAVGLCAAMDYLEGLGLEGIGSYCEGLASYACEGIRGLKGARVFGPGRGEGRGGVVSFLLEGVNSNDLVEYVDKCGVALRGGHHCTQPLMRRLGVEGTARASFYLYNGREDVDVLLEALRGAQRLFGGG